MADEKAITGKKRAATLMIAMGTDYAANIYRHLKTEEVEQLTLEIATMQRLEPEAMNGVLEEFYQMCLAQKYIMEGGVDYAKDILEKAFGAQNARNVIDKVIISLGNKSFDFMKKTDPKQLFTFIQNEHPQTIALILVHATPLQSSTILGMLPKHKQLEVIERIAKMDRVSPDVIKEVEDVLKRRISTVGVSEITDLGGVKHTAELLNMVDRSTEKYIFDELAKRDPALTEEIRKLMFVFEDIVLLDDIAMQTLNREIDTKDLIAALKTATQEVQDAFFSNMSKRAADQIREDMQYARTIRAREVEAAQARIVNKIRELEDAGTIVISHGKDDMIV